MSEARKLIWTEEELEQGSPEWFKWRDGDIAGGMAKMTLGGSEIAPLMYMSPYDTPMQVWEYKLGFAKKQFSDAATSAIERGNRLEPVARAHYEKTFGTSVRTLCAIHPKYEWMRTSLDGITEDNKAILEIKSPRSLDNHVKQTKGNMIPTYRYPQLQWQLAVMREHFPEVERVDYVSFYMEEAQNAGDDTGKEIGFVDMKVIPIYPDEDFIRELTRRGEIFIREYLETGRRPESTLFLEPDSMVLTYPRKKLPQGVYWQAGMSPAI